MADSTIPIPQGAVIGDPIGSQSASSASGATIPIPQGAVIGDPIGTAQTPATQPKENVDIIDKLAAMTPLTDRINKGLKEGVEAGFGLHDIDTDDHPYVKALSETWDNLKNAAKQSYDRMGGNQVGLPGQVVSPQVTAAALTPADMLASGIEGMASLIENGGKELIGGAKTKNPQTMARGFAKMMSGIGQASASAEAPEAPGTVVDAAKASANAAAPVVAAVAKVPSDIKSAIEDYVHPDPDEAAQKALAPSKRKAIKAQQDLAGARPYLEGAEDLEDLQKKSLAAKDEIWAPMTKAIAGPAGDVKVVGPDGPATVRDLEAERLKTRANLDLWQSLQPTDKQVQLQKAGEIKDLTERYQDITDAMDPELYKAGIDPKLIRKTFGQVQGVTKLLQGRNTLSEAAKKYGLSKIFDIDLTHPLNTLPNIVQGSKDILAGRPTFSGKPTDVNVQEGFREGTGGPKPDLTVPAGSSGPVKVNP